MPSTASPGKRKSDDPAESHNRMSTELFRVTEYEWPYVVGCCTSMVPLDWSCRGHNGEWALDKRPQRGQLRFNGGSG